ncbi:MAG: GtrA family protein [Anaerolineaceae bacterium]
MKNSQPKRFVKFALVGISGTLVDFSIFNACISLFHFDSVVASVCSFSVAVINNFIWNRLWTYPESKEKPLGSQLVKFCIVSVIGLVIRTPLFAAIEDPLIQYSSTLLRSNSSLTPVTLGHNLALGIAIIVVLFWNYFANRLWTYKGIK